MSSALAITATAPQSVNKETKARRRALFIALLLLCSHLVEAVGPRTCGHQLPAGSLVAAHRAGAAGSGAIKPRRAGLSDVRPVRTNILAVRGGNPPAIPETARFSACAKGVQCHDIVV